ncbi:hypothetical protein HK405_010921 [Cladochytrium tenue]|nr:hypothetical protein HK405_010921 [Cladochytrium tenue]
MEQSLAGLAVSSEAAINAHLADGTDDGSSATETSNRKTVNGPATEIAAVTATQEAARSTTATPIAIMRRPGSEAAANAARDPTVGLGGEGNAGAAPAPIAIMRRPGSEAAATAATTPTAGGSTVRRKSDRRSAGPGAGALYAATAYTPPVAVTTNVEVVSNTIKTDYVAPIRIMKRDPLKASGSSGSAAKSPSLRNPSSSTSSPKSDGRRTATPPPFSAAATSSGSGGADAPLAVKSLAEREAEYKAARMRIFGSDEPEVQSPVAAASGGEPGITPELPSQAPRLAGGGGGGRRGNAAESQRVGARGGAILDAGGDVRTMASGYGRGTMVPPPPVASSGAAPAWIGVGQVHGPGMGGPGVGGPGMGAMYPGTAWANPSSYGPAAPQMYGYMGAAPGYPSGLMGAGGGGGGIGGFSNGGTGYGNGAYMGMMGGGGDLTQGYPGSGGSGGGGLAYGSSTYPAYADEAAGQAVYPGAGAVGYGGNGVDFAAASAGMYARPPGGMSATGSAASRGASDPYPRLPPSHAGVGAARLGGSDPFPRQHHAHHSSTSSAGSSSSTSSSSVSSSPSTAAAIGSSAYSSPSLGAGLHSLPSSSSSSAATGRYSATYHPYGSVAGGGSGPPHPPHHQHLNPHAHQHHHQPAPHQPHAHARPRAQSSPLDEVQQQSPPPPPPQTSQPTVVTTNQPLAYDRDGGRFVPYVGGAGAGGSGSGGGGEVAGGARSAGNARQTPAASYAAAAAAAATAAATVPAASASG